jgi:hypothetical protein
MRTWWEVADEVRGGVVRAREWWIENETAAIKCRLVNAGECQSLHVVDVQTDVGFGRRRVSRKMMWKMNRYSYNLARGEAKNGRDTLANVSPSSRYDTKPLSYDAHRAYTLRSFLGHAICCSARGAAPASSPTGFAALL